MQMPPRRGGGATMAAAAGAATAGVAREASHNPAAEVAPLRSSDEIPSAEAAPHVDTHGLQMSHSLVQLCLDPSRATVLRERLARQKAQKGSAE